MESNYFTINIHEYFVQEELSLLLNNIIASYECNVNKELEGFLKNGAVNSAKQGKSATYLVFADIETPYLVGYFTIAIKPITVHRQFINAKYAQKFDRVCVFNKDEQTYHLSAYLIAQLGKNFSDTQHVIDGSELLKIAEGEINKLKIAAGGVVIFLECENKEFLKSFYTAAGYKFFGERELSNTANSEVLLQYIKTI